MIGGGTRRTLLYAYHEGAYGREYDFLQAYTKHVPEDLAAETRRRLAEIPGVIERGQYTYELAIDEESVEAGLQIWGVVADVAERV